MLKDPHAVTPEERRELKDATDRVQARLRDEAAIAQGSDPEKLEAFARWLEGVPIPEVSNSNVTSILRQQLAAVSEFARFAAR